MTRRKRSLKEAQAIKLLLADIIQDVFDKGGQLVTHELLAKRHVMRNSSTTAEEDVRIYGGPAVDYLRNELNYAIVPVTSAFYDYNDDPSDETTVANAVAGLGAGGPRIGWYHPAHKDDWLWVYYISHLGRAGVMAVFHAGRQIDRSPHLVSANGRTRIAARAIATAPLPPGKTETKVLEARLTPR